MWFNRTDQLVVSTQSFWKQPSGPVVNKLQWYGNHLHKQLYNRIISSIENKLNRQSELY